MLNDYEAAAVRSWAVDHARRAMPTNRLVTTEEIIEEARIIEQYLTGRGTASLTSIAGKHGHRK